MPKIIVNPKEKLALRSYFEQPLLYIQEKYHPYFPGGQCPNQTKIIRAYDATRLQSAQRCFLIPIGDEGISVKIPFTLHLADDLLQHSCTYVEGKFFFQQNEHDLPKWMPKNLNLNCFESDEDSDEEYDEEYKACQAKLKELKIAQYLKKNYLKDADDQGMIRQVVKYAVDEQDQDYILKVTSSMYEQFIPYRLPLVRLSNHICFFRSAYMPVLRGMSPVLRRKRIEFMPFAGEALAVFLLRFQSSISEQEMAHFVLEQYIQQIFNNGIVHTDINASNICVIMNDKMVLTYIDLSESFHVSNFEPTGKGTVGYYAPEFFIDPHDHERQLALRDESEERFLKTLKPDFRQFFSQASDIYALGCVLIDDIQVAKSSPYYALAGQMRAVNQGDRPTGDEIIGFLHDIERRSQIQNVVESPRPS